MQTVAVSARDTVERMDPVERFRARYPFPLDDFQLEAIRAVGPMAVLRQVGVS